MFALRPEKNFSGKIPSGFSFVSRRQGGEPMNPAPPVTRILICSPSIRLKQFSPLGTGQPCLDRSFSYDRVPETIVVQGRGHYECIYDGRMKNKALEIRKRSKPEKVARPARHIVTALETEINVIDLFPPDINSGEITAPQPFLVGEPDAFDLFQRIETKHAGTDRVNRDLVRARQNVILYNRPHSPGSWSITGGGAVDKRENDGMNLLLYRQKVG